MYKRKGCELWTISEEDKDYWFEQGYNNEEEKLYGFKLRNLKWNRNADLINQFDVIYERYLDIKDENGNLKREYQRFLGYLKEIKVDEIYGEYNICHCAIFIVCQHNYLKDVEIVREVEYRFER